MTPVEVGQELGGKQTQQSQEGALAVWGMLAFVPFCCPVLHPLES